MINTGTSQIFLPAKFHNFTVSGLFFIHKNKRVQFFMKHGVYQVIKNTATELLYTNECSRLNMIIEVNLFNKIKYIVGIDRFK